MNNESIEPRDAHTQTDFTDEEWMTIDQVAEHFGCPASRVLARSGEYGKQNRRQDSYNGYDDQEFDQGECPAVAWRLLCVSVCYHLHNSMIF